MSETLETPILLRCYAKPDVEKVRARATRHRKPYTPDGSKPDDTPARPPNPMDTAIKAIGAPYESWVLVFDTETTTDMRQALRFGVYGVYGLSVTDRKRLYQRGKLTRAALDHEHECGLFYNPDEISGPEITTLRTYADANGLQVMTRDDFVKGVFYKWVYRYQALCIGHNLPFDLSRLSTRVVEAGGGRGQMSENGTMTSDYYGGFSMKLCRCHGDEQCIYHPSVRIKMIAKYKAFIGFVKVSEGTRRKMQGKPTVKADFKHAYTGKFLDTATFGLALLGHGDSSLRGMGLRFKAATIKYDTDEHGAVLSHEYLGYALNDVKATFALYRAERELYKRHGISKAMWKIYSEASLGKGYLTEMHIPPFMHQHPDFPDEVIGYAMTAYYGGRSECRCRLSPVEVAYLDFKSQYPTVNALLHLQDILLAESVTTHDATDDVRRWLARGSEQLLSDMCDPDVWPQLRVLVKIAPDEDILPVRANYPMQRRPGDIGVSLNIGVNYFTAHEAWYTLADIIGSVLLTGKAPAVLAAIKIVPSAEQVATQPLTLFGDDRYHIDLRTHDFFTAVINLRGDVKAEIKRAKVEGQYADAENLGGLEIALKLLANSTAYGALMECNPDEATYEKRPVTVFGLRTTETSSNVLEWQGAYFAGPLGAFITGGGRLLLAMAEKLALDRHIFYAICDTDSMAFARPDGMARDVFQAHVRDIAAAFDALSPYQGKPPILEREDINDWGGRPEPLHCIAVSTKRYVLYNRLDDGSIRIRKFTAHGLGTWQLQERQGFTLPQGMLEPCELSEITLNDGSKKRVPDAYKLGGPLWSYALWYDFVVALETGAYPDGSALLRDKNGVPQYTPREDWLDTVAFYRQTISTWSLYERYHKYLPDLLPFSFITVLPTLNRLDILTRQRQGGSDQTAYYQQLHRAVDWDAVPMNATNAKIAELKAERDRWNVRESATWQQTQALYDSCAGHAFIAPFIRRAEDLHDVRLADEPSIAIDGIMHKTMREMLAGYFVHGEAKTGTPQGMGYLPRRDVVASGFQFVGKETSRKAMLAMEEIQDDGVLSSQDIHALDTSIDYPDAALPAWLFQLQGCNATEVAARAGLPTRGVQRIKTGAIRHPSAGTVEKLIAALATYRPKEETR